MSKMRHFFLSSFPRSFFGHHVEVMCIINGVQLFIEIISYTTIYHT